MCRVHWDCGVTAALYLLLPAAYLCVTGAMARRASDGGANIQLFVNQWYHPDHSGRQQYPPSTTQAYTQSQSQTPPQVSDAT